MHLLGLVKKPCLPMSWKSCMAQELLVSGHDKHTAVPCLPLHLTSLPTGAAESQMKEKEKGRHPLHHEWWQKEEK